MATRSGGGAAMTEDPSAIATLLNLLLSEAGLETLSEVESGNFADYLELILRWNARTNLTSVRDRDGILRRHFVECIACAQSLPQDVRSVLDFGSGAGFPGIPIAICRPELDITLAEAQNKKTAFLKEVVRTLNLRADVFSGRAESLHSTFGCITLRAVDRMTAAIEAAVALLEPTGYLAVMTTESNRDQVISAAGPSFEWQSPVQLPLSEQRVLLLGTRTS
jgi:16S rRNA (guanine527-N7)-methyltransferase